MVTNDPDMRGVYGDLTNTRLKSRAAAVSIASNSALIAFKLVLGIMSGSIAIISEALHLAAINPHRADPLAAIDREALCRPGRDGWPGPCRPAAIRPP